MLSEGKDATCDWGREKLHKRELLQKHPWEGASKPKLLIFRGGLSHTAFLMPVETIHRAGGDEAPGAQAVFCLSVTSKSDQPLSENLNWSCPGRRGARPEMMGDSILSAHMRVFGLQEYWLCPNAAAHLVWHEGCHQSSHSCPFRAQRLSIVPSILM